MYSGLISSKVPFLREKAVALLAQNYPTLQAGLNNMNSLANDYQANSPDVYSQYYSDIVIAINELRSIYQETNYPEQMLNWQTHPDNVGHKDSPGCFRCHDGKHLSPSGEAIRLECNICHNIPVVADSNQFVTNIPIVRGPEPTSHSNPSWITLHHKAIDVTCTRCHPPKDPSTDYTKLNGQKPPLDGSFCGNSACHTTQWKYMGFNSPALQPFLDKQMANIPIVTATPAPVETQALTPPPEAGGSTATPGAAPTYVGALKAIFDTRCTSCHTGSTGMANLDLSTYAGILQGTKNGAGVVPNNPDGSLIYKVQNTGGHYGQMTADELVVFKAWILAGAPEK
jgi:hypothetical protein